MVPAITVPGAGGPVTSTPPPKPVIRRPNLVRKRDEDDDVLPSSPGKKARVTFDSDVQVRMMADIDENPALIREEVRLALEKRKWGDTSDYDRLREIYEPQGDAEPQSLDLIKKHTMGLLCNVSQLNKETAGLVRAVLNSSWLGMSDDYVSLFVRLLANILSGQGMFLGDVLKMLIQNLSLNPPSNSKIPGLPGITRSVVYARVHKSLQYLLQLLPQAARVLSAVIVSSFPYHTESGRAHIVYVKNLLRITEYAPELRAHVLNLITERLVKIDVQVQVDLEELADEVGESLIDKIPQSRPGLLEDMDESDDYDSDSDDDNEEQTAESRQTKDIISNVEKMDSILDVMFTYHDQEFSGTSVEQQIAVIDTLLSQFPTIILPTYRSRHTQFLLFHFVQQSTTYIDTFVGACVQIAFDRKQPALVRQASAAYLASFVARGKHVPPNIIRDVFDYIGTELARLRRAYEPNCKGPDLRRYSSYYSLAQALLYIFCFRWRDLELRLDDDNESDDSVPTFGEMHHWRKGVKEALSVNIFSRLNPLKVCSPAIVTEFARMANHLGVVYVYHLLETNKRVRLPRLSGDSGITSTYGEPARATALSMGADESHLHLDEYFPFDPYHLPRSKHWIENDYQEWQGIPDTNDGQDSDSQSEERDATDSDLEEGTETDRTARSS